MGIHDDEAGSSRSKHSRQHKTVEEVLLPQVHLEFFLCEVNWDVLNMMGCDGEIDDMLRIRLREARSNEEIFTYVAWIRAFNINEPIYTKLCHAFYLTYEFNKVYANDELQTKKIIKFRLGGHILDTYKALRIQENLSTKCNIRSIEVPKLIIEAKKQEKRILEFVTRRTNAKTPFRPILAQVGTISGGCVLMRKDLTYTLNEELGFYYQISSFEGDSEDDHLWFVSRTTGYDKIKKNGLSLLSMFHTRHQNGHANVAWLIARKSRVLTDDVLRILSALVYCRDLDTTTLSELTDSESRLIPEYLLDRVLCEVMVIV
nr:hypothetical protein [Tanacetum cinerariifolium]